jgi:hypothetical protein
MMQNCYTIDIEAALVEEWADYSAFAPPVTAELEAPCVYIHRVGGSRQNYVQDAHQVSIDVYGATPAAAMELAGELTGKLGDLTELGGVPVYAIDITTLPYNNPDPDNYSISRATFAATVVTRVAHS